MHSVFGMKTELYGGDDVGLLTDSQHGDVPLLVLQLRRKRKSLDPPIRLCPIIADVAAIWQELLTDLVAPMADLEALLAGQPVRALHQEPAALSSDRITEQKTFIRVSAQEASVV